MFKSPTRFAVGGAFVLPKALGAIIPQCETLCQVGFQKSLTLSCSKTQNLIRDPQLQHSAANSQNLLTQSAAHTHVKKPLIRKD